MTRIVLATPIFRRPALTWVWLRHQGEAQRTLREHGIDLRVVICGSEGPISRGMVEPFGFTYVERSCQGGLLDGLPKWLAAIHAARQMDPHAVLLAGSDTFGSVALVRELADGLAGGCDYQGPRAAVVFNCATRKAVRWPGPEDATMPHGDYVLLSADLLERIGWEPWPADVQPWRSGGDQHARCLAAGAAAVVLDGHDLLTPKLPWQSATPPDALHGPALGDDETEAEFARVGLPTVEKFMRWIEQDIKEAPHGMAQG